MSGYEMIAPTPAEMSAPTPADLERLTRAVIGAARTVMAAEGRRRRAIVVGDADDEILVSIQADLYDALSRLAAAMLTRDVTLAVLDD